MSDFQVGQKVRCIKSFEGRDDLVGKAGVILELPKSSRYYYTCLWDGSADDQSATWCFPRMGYLVPFHDLPNDGRKDKWV